MSRKAAQSSSKLPRQVERMINSYVDLVLNDRPERTKAVARVGLRVLVERARRGVR